MPKTVKKAANMDFNKICRTCLSDRGHLREIFSTRIPKMIETCTSLQVCENDNLPSGICVTCFHLIAKYYTFKKKIERCDKILRHCLKQNKIKQCDIINIALSDAQIEEPSDVNDKQQNKEETFEESEDSEEDIPLSERKVKRIFLNQENNDDESISMRVKHSEIIAVKEMDSQESTCHIFSDGPPPLIPLAQVKKIDVIESKPVLDLPRDTPPLVPIKPIVDIDSVLTNVIEQKVIKLQCNNCGQDFTSITDLKDHKLKICQGNSLQCNICKKEFKESKKLIGHLKGHMVIKDYKCKICGKCYPNNSTFRVHMRTHTGERPFKCEICNKGFVRWAGVVGHMKTHESHKPYKCETCGKCFKIPSNLERHKVLHSDSLPYCCSYCGKTFSQSDNLLLHVRSYHTKERPYLCNECGKGFVSSTRLNRHMWVHSGYKPYQCQHCPKAYSNSNDLKKHERHHQSVIGKMNEEDKPYPCPTCEMRFYHPCRLARHVKTHDRPFSCSICMKSFSSNSFLNKHIENKHNIEYVEDIILEDEGVNHIFVEYE